MSNWFENHLPQRKQITNAPSILSLNWMAFSVDHNYKFSDHILLTPAIFQVTAKLFSLTRLWWQKLTWFFGLIDLHFVDCAVQFCFCCKFSLHFHLSQINSGVKFPAPITIQWDFFILYRKQITSNGFFLCSPKCVNAGFWIMLNDFDIKKL